MSEESRLKAENFLAISSQYKLGALVTESSHPDTRNLSDLSVNNLPEAISVLKGLDRNTLSVLSEKVKEICYLKDAVRDSPLQLKPYGDRYIMVNRWKTGFSALCRVVMLP